MSRESFLATVTATCDWQDAAMPGGRCGAVAAFAEQDSPDPADGLQRLCCYHAAIDAAADITQPAARAKLMADLQDQWASIDWARATK